MTDQTKDTPVVAGSNLPPAGEGRLVTPVQATGALATNSQPRVNQYAGELDRLSVAMPGVPAAPPVDTSRVVSRSRRHLGVLGGIAAVATLLIGAGAAALYMSRQNASTPVAIETEAVIPAQNLSVTPTDWLFTVNGALQVSGQSSLEELSVVTDVNIGGTLTIGGNAVFGQEVSANTIRTNGLIVGGNAIILNNLEAANVSGSFSGSYEGDGRGLTNVDALSLLGKPLSYFEDASSLLTGTLNDARLSSNVALRSTENLFTATNTFSKDLLIQGALSAVTASFSDAVSATNFTQNGFAVCDTSGNCNTATSNMFIQGGNSFGASAVLGTQDGYDLIFKTNNTNRLVIAANGAVSVIGELTATALNGNGLGITDLNASHITSGQLADSRLSTNVVLKDAANTLTGENIFSNPANSFTGNGSGLTQVDANYLGGQDGSYYTNANNIANGTLSDLRLSANVTLQGNSFNGASQLVRLLASGALPALDGSNISSVNASLLQGHAADYFTNADNIAAGTLHDDRLSSNIARLNASNAFTGASNSFVTVSAVQLLQNGNAVCDVSGNCANAGGGVTTGGGTAGYLALFTDGQIIGDSIVSQASNVITVAGTLAADFIQGDGTDIINLNASQLATGVAAVGVGGTGATTFTNNGILIGSAGGALRATAAGTTGQCLTAITGGAPVWTDCDSAAGGAAPGGTAGGDLSGTYPNPTVSGLNGTALAVSNLGGGNFLLFNGTNWVNAALSGDITATATGVTTIGNGAVTNAKLANSSLTVSAGTGLSGGGSVGLGGSTTLQVVYGTTNSSAVAGNTTLTCPAGTGNLTGGGTVITLGAGGICGNLSVIATPAFTGLTLTNALAVAYGGTGATTAAGARTNLGAAASGANNDITSLSAATSIANASADMTVGNTSRVLTLQGNASTVLRASAGGFMTTLGFATPTANVTYTLPTAAAGSYYICTSIGNCAGAGGGVTTGGGTTNTIAMFTNNGVIGDSLVSQSTATNTVTVAGTLAATAFQGSGADLTNLNGTNVTAGTVGVSVGGTGRSSFTSNGILYGSGSGTLQVTAAGTTGQCLTAITGGAPVWTDCDSAAGGAAPGGTAGGDLSGTYPNPTVARLYGTPLSINTLTSGQVLVYDGTNWANRSLSGDMTVHMTGMVTIANGAVTNAKLANSSLTVSAGTGLSGGGSVSLGGSTSLSVTYGSSAGTAAQGNAGLSFTGAGNLTGTVSGTAGGGFTSNTLAVVSNPTFSGLVTANGGLTASSVSFSGSLTQTGSTGVITLGSLSTGIVQSNASGVITSGNIDRNSALLVGQTSVANGGTGATTAAAARTNLSAAVRGAHNDITSLTAVTAIGNTAADLAVGSTGRALTLQGNASTILAASANGFTTTLGFATPSANVTYLLPTVAAGSYNICTSSGNCGYAPSTGSGSYINNQYAGAQTGNLWITGTAQTGAIISASINSTGALQTAGVTRITASGELQNVTANANMLTAGTLDDARLSGNVAIDRGTVPDGTDFNAITAQGTYRVAGGTYTNFPSGVYNYGTLVVSTSGNSVTQNYYPHANGVTGNWTRTKWNASDWNIWVVFWSSANDGSGSGLDADLLDGNDSSYYRNAGNLNTGTVPNAQLPERIRVAAQGIADWNNATTNGWYMASGAANAPTAGATWYIGEVVAHNSLWITQTVWAFTNDSSSNTQMYRRDSLDSGGGTITWNAWYKLQVSQAEQDARYAAISGSGNYIQNTTTPQTANFNIAGNGTISGSLSISDAGSAAGAVKLMLGDDTYLTDIDVANTLGLYGAGNSAVGGLRLGSAGPILFGSGGYLGLGTTSPDYALTVSNFQGQNGIKINSVAGGNPQLVLTENGTLRSAFSYISSDQTLRVYNNGYDGMVIGSTGNVGIGTVTPNRKLTVVGSGAANIDLAVTGRIQTGDGSGVGGVWVDNTNTKFMGANGTTLGLYNSGNWVLQATSTSVGIGTGNPGAKLEVKDGSILVNADSTYADIRVQRTGATYVAMGVSSASDQAFVGSGGSLKFLVDGTNTYKEAMRIQAGGNIGIGTTAPAARLTVNGPVTSSYSADYQAGYYYCPSGGTLSGTNCVSGANYAASYQSGYYYCPSGGTLSGTTCSSSSSYNASYQSGYYYCGSGASASGTTCSYSAVATSSCESATLYNGSCYEYVANTTTMCNRNNLGMTNGPNGYACYYIYSPTTSYSCPNGGSLNGSTCSYSAYYQSGYYYCPSGGTLSGTTCSSSSSYNASYQSGYYYCPSGGTLSGSTCNNTTSYGASYQDEMYSCPSGGTLTETDCISINKLLVVQAGAANVMSVDSDGNMHALGTITGGVASPDYAENIGVSDPSIEAADVVAMDPNRTEWAIKANQPYSTRLLGVISTSPGFLTNAGGVDTPSPKDQRPLALSGRVPVKVSTINGVIRQGDYLTSSIIPGVAMKATGQGAVIGVAMEDFNGTEDDTYACGEGYVCGRVLLFINPSASNPGVENLMVQGGDIVLNALTVNGALNADMINVGGMLTTGELTVIGSTAIGGNLTVQGLTRVQDIEIGGHLITAGETPQTLIGLAAGQDATVSLLGNDTSGTITVTAGTNGMASGEQVSIQFAAPYTNIPRVMITANDGISAGAQVYPSEIREAGFKVNFNQPPTAGAIYSFTYFVVQ